MAHRLWSHVGGEPFMVNPPMDLAIWNPKRRKAHRAVRREHRPRVRMAKGGTVFILGERSPYKRQVHRVNPKKRRGHMARGRRKMSALQRMYFGKGHAYHGRRRARTRGGYARTRRHRYAMNMPRRHSYGRRYRRRNPDGFMPRGGLMAYGMPVVAGVASALVLQWGMPFVTRQFNLAPAGLMYRAAQAGVVLGGAWAARSFGMFRGEQLKIFTAVGLSLVALGLLSDFNLGAIGPAAPGAPGVSGMGYYAAALEGFSDGGDSGDNGSADAAGGVGYYEAVPGLSQTYALTPYGTA